MWQKGKVTLVRNHVAEFVSANDNFFGITAAKETVWACLTLQRAPD